MYFRQSACDGVKRTTSRTQSRELLLRYGDQKRHVLTTSGFRMSVRVLRAALGRIAALLVPCRARTHLLAGTVSQADRMRSFAGVQHAARNPSFTIPPNTSKSGSYSVHDPASDIRGYAAETGWLCALVARTIAPSSAASVEPMRTPILATAISGRTV